MARDLNVHVVPEGDEWAVKEEGAQRAARRFATQEEAAEAGRQLAQRNHSELLIHGRDGQIRARNSYGNDPHPPRG
jgi:ketosteroid isomerase-like protein